MSIVTIITIAGFILAIMGIKILNPRKSGVVLFLGKVSRVIREGFNMTIPFLETVVYQTLAMINLNVSVDGITNDNVKTTVTINVIYFVRDDDQSIIDSLFKNQNVVQTIKSMVEEQLRAKIYTFNHEEIFGKRSEIGDEIKATLEEKLGEFGMKLDSVQVVDIQLDHNVIEAMNRVVASQKNRIAAIEDAEAKKKAQILSAEADKEMKRLLGEGMAAQREAIAAGFKDSIEQIKGTDTGLTAKEILDFLLTASRIETLEKIGMNNAKIIYVNENLEAKTASMIQQTGSN
ncbi:MAG: SPFH domain-containing protein [Candidatus Absconditabacterales bacterium]|nr:SPFH domain-containing protein [Candidatus Absconditabacterales bacterium]